MIRIGFNGTDRRVVQAMTARGPRLVTALTRTLDQLMLELQARIQQKLSGEVLKSRRGGGGLLGTVRKEPTVATGRTISGNVLAGGGMFWWAIVHEKGGEKEYEILPGAVTGKSDKKALAFFPTGSAGAGFGRTALTELRFAAGKQRGALRPKKYGAFAAAGGVVVRSVHHPPLPKRSFMATSLEELRVRMIRTIFSSASEALRT